MITIVEGEGVGAGKSYYVVSYLLGYLAAGGTVVTTSNFKLVWQVFKELAADRFGVELEDDQYQIIDADETHRLHELTPPGTDDNQVLLVLDEAQDQLNTRDTRDEKKRGLFSWMCQSRHDNNDLLIVTQDRNNVDVQIRRLATYVIRVRNMATFMVLGMTWPFKQFLWKICDRTGKNVLRTTWAWHDKRIFGAYVSKAMQGTHQRVGAAVPRKQLRRVKKKPMKFLLVIIMIGLIVGGTIAVPRVMQSWGGSKKATPTPVPVAPGRTVQSPSASTPVKLYELSTELFRGTDNSTYLRTDVATYEVGRMSRRGFVERVDNKVAKIRTPEGQMLFVVADETAELRAQSPVIAKPIQSVGPVIDVKPPELTKIERARAGVGPDDKMERVRAGLPPRDS